MEQYTLEFDLCQTGVPATRPGSLRRAFAGELSSPGRLETTEAQSSTVLCARRRRAELPRARHANRFLEPGARAGELSSPLHYVLTRGQSSTQRVVHSAGELSSPARRFDTPELSPLADAGRTNELEKETRVCAIFVGIVSDSASGRPYSLPRPFALGADAASEFATGMG